MLKLLTLDGDYSYSDDAVYRILSRMEFYGLYSENIFSHHNLDELIDEAAIDIEEGRDIILAIEPSQFTYAKEVLLNRLLVETTSCADISEAVSIQLMSDYNEEPIDLPGQCLMPHDGKVLMSNDGMYCGFGYTADKGNLLFFLPLDYSRIDSVIDELVKSYFSPQQPDNSGYEERGADVSDDSYAPLLQNLVYSLVQLDKRVAFSDSEAIELIKPFTDVVDGFGAVAYFVRNDTPTSYDLDKTQLYTIRRAREALAKTGADYGCAVSEIIMSDSATKSMYTAFVAVYDGHDTIIKKITTDRAQNVDLILPKAVTLLLDILCEKSDILADGNVNAVSMPKDDDEDDKPKEMNKSMLIIAALVALIAIICAVIFTISSLKENEETTAAPVVNPIGQSTDVYSVPDSIQPTTEPTTLVPGITTPTDTTAYTTAPTEISTATTAPTGYNSLETEPTAGQQTTTPTSAVSSTSGTFVFYVFGYGHGVGLSQTGANAYAKQGWNYAEILANYYYNTTLVIGDTCPKTIRYAGSEYKTRDYLASALVSEMSESYELEALKAQVVALYTYAKYYEFNVSATGNAYGKTPGDKAYKAVDAVMGNYLSYNGETALTPFYAMSAGKSTSYYNAWGGTELPYLAGGRPSYSDYYEEDFQTVYTISSDEMKKAVKERCNIELVGDPSTWLSVVSHDSCIDENTGYVYKINVGGTMYTGYKFRNEVMKGTIRSHCFKLIYIPDSN